MASMKEGSRSSSDSEQQSEIVGEEKTDDMTWENENTSYDELLIESLENEEEQLKVSNFKLKLSEEEIIKLQIQIEKSEGQLNNALVELKVKKDRLLLQDCKVGGPAEEQLKISSDEIARLKEEFNSSSSGTRELQGQLEVARENLATLECQLDSKRKQIRDLEDRVTRYEVKVKVGFAFLYF
ncbi:tropomyosin isoform X1 [Spatholobus suberectus]|nr:tropomyosin isoform X1 [Spatholobus suberectus]